MLSVLGRGTDSIEMRADYTHKVAGAHIKYLAGYTYHNVPASVARAITQAAAGHLVDA